MLKIKIRGCFNSFQNPHLLRHFLLLLLSLSLCSLECVGEEFVGVATTHRREAEVAAECALKHGAGEAVAIPGSVASE